MSTKGIPLGVVEKAVNVRSSRARARFRHELQERHGLGVLPTQAEIALASAGNALVAGDPPKVARLLEQADRACAGAARAASKPRPRPSPAPSPAPAAARLAALKGVKSPLDSSADLPPEKTQLERLRAEIQVAPPPKEIPPLDQWKAPR